MAEQQKLLSKPKEWMGLPSFSSVGAGQTPVLSVNTNYTLHTLKIDYEENGVFANQAAMEAALTEIRLIVNGKVQRSHSAAQLIALNAFHGTAFKDGEIVIHFSEPWRTTEAHQDFFAWGQGDVQTFEIEIDIASGTVAPVLSEARAEITRDVRPLGAIVKYKHHSIQVSAAGEVEWHPLKQDAYFAMHFLSEDIDAITVKMNREDLIDNLSKRHISNDLLDAGWAEQTGYTHLKFDRNGRATDGIKTRDQDGNQVDEFTVLLEMGAATPVRVMTETYGLRD